MVLNELSLQKFFVWFILFFIFVFYFWFDVKFQVFIYSDFLFKSLWNDKKSSQVNVGLNKYISNDYDRLTEYYETHKRISQMNVSLRKISFNECVQAGYGNRLYSVLSSFLIALLTNSSLVIKWKEIESYVDLPIRVFDNNITRDEGLSKEEFAKKFYHANPAQSWSRTKNIEALMKTNVPETPLRYLYHEIGPYFMEICSNPIYFSKFTYYNLVNNETINLALEVISNKKSTHIDRQEKIFKVGFEVGGNLLNRFWRPIKSIMNDVKRFKEKYFQNYFVIGFQLRFHYLNKNDTNKFISCALEIERKYLFENSFPKVNSFKWFIASDSQEEINGILKMYPNRTFTTNEYTLGHIVHNQQSIYRAILDVELLSICNELIVTGGSTFGWVAAMKSLKLPMYINGQNRMDKCLRSSLSDPPSGGQGPYASFRK